MFITCLKNGKALKIIFMALLVGVFCPLMMWGQTLGDVDSSGTVDIIDALLTAQYYVGLNPVNFQAAYADVDGSSDIDIIDALLMAQFYVGLITEFPADLPGPTPEITPAPEGETDIVLNGNSITVNGAGAAVDGTNVTISAGGTYNISGTLNDGRIIVDTEDELLVTLNLNGINIYSSVNSPLSIMNAPEGADIVLGDNTVNYITDSSSYTFEGDDDEPNAALFSKDDMDIIGTGTLIVDANYNDGISTKDDMNIKDCTIIVTSVDDGIRGKNSIEIKSDAHITINSAGDCLKSDDDEDGLIEIKACVVDLTSSGGDGMDAEIAVTVTNDDSHVDVTTGGGSNVTPDSEISTKGIKGTGSVVIEDGIIMVNSSDDTIHSNDTITISGGTLTLASGDDTIHADLNVTVDGGDINITKSYEGLESEVVTVNNGTIYVISSDDALNAADCTVTEGTSRPPTGEFYLNLNGGYIYVDASGDGLDANGYIVMTNGTVLINGPVERMNAALDYDLGCTLSGGFLVAAGSSRMSQTGDASSTQNCLLINFSSQLQAGSYVNIQTSNNTSILTFAPLKAYQSIAFSSPDLIMGTTYNVYTGGNATGTIVDGLLQSGTYNPGSLYTSFTVNNVVTNGL